jgi:hypothetical protein
MIGRRHAQWDYLIKWIPSFYHTPLLDFPDDVTVALPALLRLNVFSRSVSKPNPCRGTAFVGLPSVSFIR